LINYWLFKVDSKSDLWTLWKKEHVISIDWNIGNIANSSIEEIKSKLVNNSSFSQTSDYIFNILHTFIGLLFGVEAMEDGDVVLLVDQEIILDFGILSIFEYKENGLTSNNDHTYCRKIRFLKKGPIKIANLPKEFQQNGIYPIHLTDDIQKYSITKEVFENLLANIK